MSTKCARKGCDREAVEDGIWCADHEACGVSVTCDNLPVVVSGVSAGDYIAAMRRLACPRQHGECWSALRRQVAAILVRWGIGREDRWAAWSEDARVDPETVARMKVASDVELADLIDQLAEVLS